MAGSLVGRTHSTGEGECVVETGRDAPAKVRGRMLLCHYLLQPRGRAGNITLAGTWDTKQSSDAVPNAAKCVLVLGGAAPDMHPKDMQSADATVVYHMLVPDPARSEFTFEKLQKYLRHTGGSTVARVNYMADELHPDVQARLKQVPASPCRRNFCHGQAVSI